MIFIKARFLFIFLFFPVFAFSFSSAELDSLESSGSKSSSQKTWQTELNMGLKRNLEIGSHLNISELFASKKNTSLLDFSNLFYFVSLQTAYSFKKIAKKYDFLKKMRIFAAGGFNSPFKDKKILSYADYIYWGLDDITIGLNHPLYKKQNFFSEFSLYYIPFPLSRFARKAGLFMSAGGLVNFIYFLKKEKKESLALFSSHSLGTSRFNKESADKKSHEKNIPFYTKSLFSLIYKQNQQRIYPASVSFFLSHFLGINSYCREKSVRGDKLKSCNDSSWKFIRYGTRLQDLSLGLASSWKAKNQLYINFSIQWKDRINAYHPSDQWIEAPSPSFSLNKFFFILSGLYSF